MLIRSGLRLYGVLVAAALLLAATPAYAQFQPRKLEDPATGEKFHIEGSAGIWSPGTSITINASAALGIEGTDIDLVKDLGLQDRKLREFHIVAKPARKHKFRFQYIPLDFQREGYTLKREVIFQGQRYSVGIPVNWLVDWKAYRFGYEYDVYAGSKGFVGALLDVKYTDVYSSLQTPLQTKAEFVHAKGPIPAIGGIGRYYFVPNISITGELSDFMIPDSVSRNLGFDGHYLELDIYGTVNFTNNVGAQIGYRKFDVGVAFTDHDATSTGTFNVKGLYFGIVARY